MKQHILTPLLTAIVLLSLFSSANAAPPYLPSGSNLSYGYTAHNQMVVSYINNPAAAGTARKMNEDVNSYQFGILTFGIGVEFGAVDDLFVTIDEQIARIQNSNLLSTDLTSPTAVEAEITTLVDEVNTTLTTIDEKGYGKAFTSFNVPMTPLVIAADWFGGAWTFDANISATSRAEVINKDIIFTSLLDTADDIAVTAPVNPGDTYSIAIESDSTLLVRAAAVAEISLGYATRLFPMPVGDMYLGVRGKYYRVGLIQAVQRLGDVLNSDSQASFDNIDNQDFSDSTGFGVDIGLLWQMAYLQVGATIENINEPSFDYTPLDYSNYKYQNTGAALELKGLSNYVMQQQLKFEASLHSESKLFALNASLDANSVTDPFGDEYQWASANVSFNINSWFLPDLRVGYRANLAGSELSFATAGLSAFKILTVDVAYGLEEVVIDGSTARRSYSANIGVQFSL